jgi:hypothetical protein
MLGRTIAIVSFALTTAAAAQNTGEVIIKVNVEEIAVLQTTVQSATVTLTDTSTGVAGSANVFAPTTGMAQFTLLTNYCIDSIDFDFPTVTGVRTNPAAYFGAATGTATGNTLGVLPYVRYDTGITTFGPLASLSGRMTDAPLNVSGSSGGFCEGAHDIFIGAATRWDLTIPTEPLYALADTYRLPVTATIIP